MKKKFLKSLSIVLCTSVITGSVLPASAYDLDEHGYSIESVEYQNSEDEDFSNTSNVFAELASIYKVTIPKYLVLSGESKKTNYFVKVEGDIAGYENISVKPDNKVNFYSAGKDMQIGTIMQDKTLWQVDNFNKDAKGSILAKNITAGKWTGTFNFNLNFTTEKVAGDIIIPEDQWSDTEMDISLKLGESKIIKTFDNVSLSSSNEDVISVEGNKLNALKVGESKITVTKNIRGASNRQILNATVVKTVNDVHIHTRGDVVEENKIAATCVKDGTVDEVIYCITCGEEVERNTKTIPAAGHILDTKVVKDEKATCTKQGEYSTRKYCTVCGEEFEIDTKIFDATGHNYNEGKITSTASCTEDGVKTYTCTVCGDTKTEAISKLGHTPGEFTTVKEATCTENGRMEQICITCGILLDSKVLATTGHTPKQAVKENEIAATCEKDGTVDEVIYCDTCGAEISRTKKAISKLGHTANPVIQENKKNATCTTKGSVENVVYCKTCNKELSRTTSEIAALGHDYKISENNGVKTTTCSRCNYEETTYLVTTQFSEGISNVTGEGYYKKGDTITLTATVADCANWVNWTGNSTNTNKSFTFTMPEKAVTYKANATANSSATTHSWKQTVNQAATCDTDSVESFVCTKCGLTKTTHNTKMTGHKADTNKDVVTAATCTTQGYTTHTCSVCKKTYVDSYKNVLGHSYNTAGICTRCGDSNVANLAPGCYTTKVENGVTKYTQKYSWQEMMDQGFFSISNDGTLTMREINSTTSSSPYSNKIEGFVVIPETVKKINSGAFYNCTKVTGYYIPKTVQTFNSGWNVNGIKDIYISDENPYLSMENGGIYSKDKTILYDTVKQKTGVFTINSNCKTLASNAMANAKFTAVYIPDGVETLNGSAMRNMPNIKEVNIPKSVKTINSGFMTCCGTNFVSITVDSNNPNYTAVDGVLYTKNMKTLVLVPSGYEKDLIIPEGVTTILEAAHACTKIKNIYIPDTVTKITAYAFNNCKNAIINKIPVNPNYTTIEGNVFNNCKIQTFTIPSYITKIGRSNFSNQNNVIFEDTTHKWKATLQSGGNANSVIPNESFDVTDPAQNGKYFKNSVYYNWTRQ